MAVKDPASIQRHSHLMPTVSRKALTKQAERIAKQVDQYESFLNKVTYCLGVLSFGLFCYLLGSRPQEIPRLYCFFFIFVVPLRWVYYRIKNWHYYLLDFCYYANAIFVSMLLFYPDNKKLFMLCFSFSEGPLAWALIVWRCSLVFSSIDKIISVVIHLLPGTVFFILRWWDTNSFTLNVHEAGPTSSWPSVNSIPTLWVWLFFVPLTVYCVWQILYFAIVEGFRRQRILKDPKLMTSYRELKRKAERANNIWWHLSGLLGAEKRVYMYAVIQAAFTVATLALTVPMFKSYRLHIGFEVFKLAATVWNGGRFIFEVMPRQAAKKAELKTVHTSSCHSAFIQKQDTKSSSVHCIKTLQYEKQSLCSNCERRVLESSLGSNTGDVKDQDRVAALEIIRSTVINFPQMTKPDESCAKQNAAAVGLQWRGQLAYVS